MLKHHHFTIGTFVLYILGMTALMIWQGVGIAPDRYALILLLGALLVRRTREFLMDWIPFLFILISYDFLRGFADNLSTRVNFHDLLLADKILFAGIIPTQTLQEHFYNAGRVQWYDVLATIFYFLHFALPLGFGYLLWLFQRDRFRQFVIGILLLSYAGWLTFLVFPSAPPWLAAQEGLLPGVSQILNDSLALFPAALELPTIYHRLNPNPVAALPSMHAAYPFLVLLFAWQFFGRKALFFLIYVLAAWISFVYLGEHYVIDILVGALYATVFFYLSQVIFAKIVRK